MSAPPPFLGLLILALSVSGAAISPSTLSRVRGGSGDFPKDVTEGGTNWFLSARRLFSDVVSSIDGRRRRLNHEDDGQDTAGLAEDFSIDDDNCFGWQDDWTDDEYKPCWDGTFKYELDPNEAPERCKDYEPGDETDDWMDVCAEWYLTYGCAEGGQEAKECGSKEPGAKEICCGGHRCAADKTTTSCELQTPTAAPTARCSGAGEEAKECGAKGGAAESCCSGFQCGDDKMCYPIVTCAVPGSRAIACGAGQDALFQFPSTCCDGLVCADTGDRCVVPTPPNDCIDVEHSILYLSPSGYQRNSMCGQLTVELSSVELKCSRMVVGTIYQVSDFCPVTCGVCAPLIPTDAPISTPTMASQTNAPISAPATASPAASPTGPTIHDISLVPFSSFFMDVTFALGSQRQRALLSFDEEALEQKVADHLSNELQQFQGFSSVDLDMVKVNEKVEDEKSTVSYAFTGSARFLSSDFSQLPTPSEIDAAILKSFQDEVFLSSLQTSTDPGVASATAVTVSQITESPSPGIGTKPPASDTEPTPKDSSPPVGVIAGVAVGVCVLCLVIVFGIYRRRKMSKSPYRNSSLSPLSKKAAASFSNSPGSKGKADKNKYYEEMSVSDGASNFSGLNHDKISIGYTDQGGQEFNPLGPMHDNISLGDGSFTVGGPESHTHRQTSSLGSIGDYSNVGGNGTSIGDDQSLANMSALGEVRLTKVLSVQSEDGTGGDRSIGGESEFNEVWKEGQGSVTGASDQGNTAMQLDYGAAVAGSVLYQGREKPPTLDVIRDDSNGSP